MYSAMRALIEPDGFMNSHLAKTPSTSISGVSPIASRIDADTELKRVAIRESCSAARPTVIPPRASTMADPRQAAAGPVLGRSPAHRRLPPPTLFQARHGTRFPRRLPPRAARAGTAGDRAGVLPSTVAPSVAVDAGRLADRHRPPVGRPDLRAGPLQHRLPPAAPGAGDRGLRLVAAATPDAVARDRPAGPHRPGRAGLCMDAARGLTP